MRKGKDKNIPIISQSDDEKLERGVEELQGVLPKYRSSVRLEADRPEFFWIRQRNAIMERFHRPRSPKRRPALLWAPAAVAVLLCLFFFAENSKAPPADLAAGYDQDLLVEIERALSQNCPDALVPAQFIIQEMEQNKALTKHP